MKKYRTSNGYRLILDPGEYYVGQSPMVISTLLGSCVAACLYDPVNSVAGMNHYLLAKRRSIGDTPITGSELGRYGTHAMKRLIDQMLLKGAKHKYLVAKVFGGGDVLHQHRGREKNSFSVGQVNARFVQNFLEREAIPVTAQDLGRNYGRVIHFDTRDYSVYMRKILHNDDQSILVEECSFEEKYQRI